MSRYKKTDKEARYIKCPHCNHIRHSKLKAPYTCTVCTRKVKKVILV